MKEVLFDVTDDPLALVSVVDLRPFKDNVLTGRGRVSNGLGRLGILQHESNLKPFGTIVAAVLVQMEAAGRDD